MATLYIHVGTHKTGTTAIQNALQQTGEEKYVTGQCAFLQNPRVSSEFMKSEVYNQAIVSRLSSDLKRLALPHQSATRLIMSCESLSGSPWSGYQNSRIAAQMLRQATLSYSVKIIVYLRRQDDFVESMYTQSVKEGHSASFVDFLSRIDRGVGLNYSRILEHWRSEFGNDNLIVRSYHDASRTGLIDDFSGAIEFEALTASPHPKGNPGYSRNALAIALIANKRLDQSAKRRLRKALQETMPKSRAENYNFFKGTERARFLDHYDTSNREVADRYFGGKLEIAFPNQCQDIQSHQGFENISQEQVADLAVALLSELGSADSSVKSKIRDTLERNPRLLSIARKMLMRP